jgi:hypothetical protein
MRFRAIAALMLFGSVAVIWGVTEHKFSLSPHKFGDSLGISLIALVGLCGLWGLIFGGLDGKK